MYASVVMPTYNRRAYVGQAIESVLTQQHAEFELIIIDDASSDGTLEIVWDYMRRDRRIRVARHAENKGLTATLNEGLQLANHDLVARMDDDDIMLPLRLRRQIEFMNANPRASVVSSWAYAIDGSNRIIGKSCPEVDLDRGKAECRPELFLELIHPATMYRRRDILNVGGYKSPILEDRDLWGRLATAGYGICVQPEFLIYQRRHGHSLSTKDLDRLFAFGDFIDFNVVRRLRGVEEFSFDQYISHLASLPLSTRFTRAVIRRSEIAFRLATVDYSRKDWLSFFGNIALALVLRPRGTFGRIREKYLFDEGGRVSALDKRRLCEP